MKIIKKTLLLVLLVLALGLASCISDKDKFLKEYSYYLDEANVPEKWTWFDKGTYEDAINEKLYTKCIFNDILLKIEKGEKFVVYFGFNPAYYQCPYCVVSLPIAVEAAKEVNLDTIYYLDIYQMRTNNTGEYQWLYQYILDHTEEYGSRISVPDYFVFDGGEIKGHHCATLTYQDEEGKSKYYVDLTAEQKQELKQIYIDLFKLAK